LTQINPEWFIGIVWTTHPIARDLDHGRNDD
jgi:hypothetical protein